MYSLSQGVNQLDLWCEYFSPYGKLNTPTPDHKFLPQGDTSKSPSGEIFEFMGFVSLGCLVWGMHPIQWHFPRLCDKNIMVAPVVSPEALAALQSDFADLVDQLSTAKNGALILEALSTLVHIARTGTDRLDWKILVGSLHDMQQAFSVFYPYRHTRKIAIFGSARTPETAPEYGMAHDVAECMMHQGFMVMTGAGGGIMAAANQGAGREASFGLNVQLPFEQEANPHIKGDPKLLQFKYFFTRKLFFLRETDGVVVFPGGFGTLDEAFECLTLIQTGKFGPAPVVLVDHPQGTYWKAWDHYVREQLIRQHFISAADPSIYTITDRLDVACQSIARFYRVYHSSRYVGDRFVMRLTTELADADLELLNHQFADLVTQDKIRKSPALPAEIGSETEHLPRLVFHFNQRATGRLYQFINTINDLASVTVPPASPGTK